MKKIKVWFSDFWPGWNNTCNFFTEGFLEGISFEVSWNKPDLLIYSCFGNQHEKYNCKKIFWTGENVRPNFYKCDLALTFDYNEDPRHLRLPLYVIEYWNAIYAWGFEGDYETFLISKKHGLNIHSSKFCNFIYGNGGTGINHWGNLQDGVSMRISLFHKLNKYKKVDACGTLLNNTGIHVRPEMEKLNFIRKYKFTFAIENSSYPGYVTEKIIDPMMAGSIPIYWGSNRIHEDFNEKSFINCHNFNDEEEIIEHIINLDKDDNLYDKMYAESWLKEEKLTEYFDINKVNVFIKTIL